MALQLPDLENGGPSRLTDKFASTTTLWLVLRKFESASGDVHATHNFTARARPQTNIAESGPGRLFYESPVVNVMGRELVAFADLQKTLAQLGFNSGSVLLRLSFRATHTPLEEAMTEIDQYFRSAEAANSSGSHAVGIGNVGSIHGSNEPIFNRETDNEPPPPDPQTSSRPESRSAEPINAPRSPGTEDVDPLASLNSDQIVTGPAQRPIAVFAPPSTSTPAAARQAYNEKDYEPTVDHAKLHQSRLSTFGRNKTLPSDAELAAQAEARARQKAAVTSVKIKVRFPDQLQVITEFSNVATNEHLYKHVRELLQHESEPFLLNYSTTDGPRRIPIEGNLRLINDLNMKSNVLVNLIWEEGASNKARSEATLKEEFRKNASEIEVREPQGVDVSEDLESHAKGKGKGKHEGEKRGSVPKWLKLPGKK